MNMRNSLYTLIVVLSSFTLSPLALAQDEVRYISDVLFVPLRSGQGNQFRIINSSLKSGAKLIFIEEGDTGEWTKVRTANGVEGWIRNQYLIDHETAQTKLNRALAELAKLKKSNQQLSTQNQQLKNTNASLNEKTESSSKSQSQMAEELRKIKTLSAGAISLEKRYTELLEKHHLLQTENDVLTAENEKLENDNRVTFMVYGVGILLLGVVLAYVLPALKPKNKHSDWR
ncbi:SH3 domain protein [Alteromonadaceae bacterium Bs31]|nr:SH3 domain protein [Alteromonadaceae bacterium Bs31]